MPFLYSGTVTSEITSVCSLIEQLTHRLQTRLDYEDIQDLRLILSELMINSCEHGNANDRRKLVSLDLMVTEEEIDLTVTDEGQGFQVDLSQFNPLNLSCSGRGLKIVSSLCDEFSVQDARVHCRLRLNKDDTAEQQ